MRAYSTTSSLFALTLCLACAAVLSMLTAPSIHAATVLERPVVKSFDGSDTTAGKFKSAKYIAVDQSTGTVYVTDADSNPLDEARLVDKFDADGKAQPFSCTGGSSLRYEAPGAGLVSWPVVIDNSGNAPGQFYLLPLDMLKAFESCGSPLWTSKVDSGPGDCVAIDQEGHPWVSVGAEHRLKEYSSSGSPPPQIGEIDGVSGCGLAFDSGNNFYIGQAEGVAKYVNKAFSSILDPYSSRGISVSSADGHVFVAHDGVVFEFNASGNLVDRFGEGTLTSGVRGISYNEALDRVYVSEGSKVWIFGPAKSLGSAPDVAIGVPQSGSVDSVHFSGSINPLGLENSYHFEYKADASAAWTGTIMTTATSHIVPADSIVHQVTADVSGLKAFTQYQARLVASNDETGTVNVSQAISFRTGRPTKVTICDLPIEIGTHSAHVCGTVTPEDSEATWKFQTSTSENCLTGSGFIDGQFHIIPANDGTTEVSESLSGLLPDQQYCVRISASNSAGTSMSEIKQFTTDAEPPKVMARGAAPRTESSARLNAFVTPENAETSYHFEYTDDGGESWVSTPTQVITDGVTVAVLVSAEISGLETGTNYAFRVAVESDGGTLVSGVQEFTPLAPQPQGCANDDVRANQHTMFLGSCRGIELVNSPDKGNQNVLAEAPAVGSSPMSASGDDVIWRVAGGAPDGPSGALSAFLAQRTEAGWASTSIAPPAAVQFGGGRLTYELNAVSPDFRTFVFGVRGSTGLDRPPAPTVVRIRMAPQSQDILKTYVGEPENLTWEKTTDLTDDGTHVFFINAQSGQLEDIGKAQLGPPEVQGEVVSVMPEGKENECHLDAFGGTSFGTPMQPGYHWVATDDASHVYFRAKPNVEEPCKNVPLGLYVRNLQSKKTTLIDSGNPGFLRADGPGVHAYFITSSKLDPADKNAGGDVYRWNDNNDTATCLTCLTAEGAGLTAGVGGFPFRGDALVSDDFSHVYFLSPNELVSGVGAPGKSNLYAVSDTGLHFVATVAQDTLATVGLSRNGQTLLFRASVGSNGSELTTDSLSALCEKPGGGQGSCEELYRYADADQSIECLSCKHNGITSRSLGTPYQGSGFDFRQSEDGTTTAFATSQALVPLDVNSDTDIYEWRNGRVHLISDGVSTFQQGFSAPRVMAVDDTGSNILFALVPPDGSLTGFERDRVANLYDARIGGGFSPPSPEGKCNEDSCQGPLQAPPPSPVAGSTGSSRGDARSPKIGCAKFGVHSHRHCRKHKKPGHRHPHRKASRIDRGGAK